MIPEFKSRPMGTGMLDVVARGVGVRIDQPGCRGRQQRDGACRQAQDKPARVPRDVLLLWLWHSARVVALANTPLLTSGASRADIQA